MKANVFFIVCTGAGTLDVAWRRSEESQIIRAATGLRSCFYERSSLRKVELLRHTEGQPRGVTVIIKKKKV